jgi:hypothetical protein
VRGVRREGYGVDSYGVDSYGATATEPDNSLDAETAALLQRRGYVTALPTRRRAKYQRPRS